MSGKFLRHNVLAIRLNFKTYTLFVYCLSCCIYEYFARIYTDNESIIGLEKLLIYNQYIFTTTSQSNYVQEEILVKLISFSTI